MKAEMEVKKKQTKLCQWKAAHHRAELSKKNYSISFEKYKTLCDF